MQMQGADFARLLIRATKCIGRPIRHSVPLRRDVMTAVLVGFEWHGGCPGWSETGLCIPSNPRASNDRSVQQGHGTLFPVETLATLSTRLLACPTLVAVYEQNPVAILVSSKQSIRRASWQD